MAVSQAAGPVAANAVANQPMGGLPAVAPNVNQAGVDAVNAPGIPSLPQRPPSLKDLEVKSPSAGGLLDGDASTISSTSGSKYGNKHSAKMMSAQEAHLASNKGKEDTVNDMGAVITHKYNADEVLQGKEATDTNANRQHKSVESE